MYHKILLLSIFSISFLWSCKDNATNPQPEIDYVTIGTQIWKLKDLNVEHYRNGDPIPEVKDSAQWFNLKTGAWCHFNNDPSLDSIYGKLYNWYALNDPRGLAPAGWHVPSKEEWETLIAFLGGQENAGGKLKDTGSVYWQGPNTGATNESGFSALPGGVRTSDKGFSGMSTYNYWWSSTAFPPEHAWHIQLLAPSSWVNYAGFNKSAGCSVRCIKD